jgi:hypothetical protein
MPVYAGDDRGADLRAKQILDELRTFVDGPTVDQIEKGWKEGIVSLADLEETRHRFIKMREMVKQLGY